MILIDSADHKLILQGLKSPAVSGFTTNPTLLSQAIGKPTLTVNEYLDHAEMLCRISEEIELPNLRHIMVQVVGHSKLWEGQIFRFSKVTKAWRGRGTLWIKLPPTTDGLAACAIVKKAGLNALVTAVYSPSQALATIESSADGIAVYLRRMIENDKNWCQRLEVISKLFKQHNKTLLIASISNMSFLESALNFSWDVTVSPGVMDSFLANELSEAALQAFNDCIRM